MKNVWQELLFSDLENSRLCHAFVNRLGLFYFFLSILEPGPISTSKSTFRAEQSGKRYFRYRLRFSCVKIRQVILPLC